MARPVDGERFDVQPLLDKTGAENWEILAEVVGVPQSTLMGWVRRGMSFHQADIAACRAGYHPATVWPEWFPDSRPAAHDTTAALFAALGAELADAGWGMAESA